KRDWSSDVCSSDLIKIGFIAATVEFTPFYLALDWEVEGAFERIEKYLQELKPQVDVIIMMSHLGMYDDETLANKFPEIDLILSRSEERRVGKECRARW